MLGNVVGPATVKKITFSRYNQWIKLDGSEYYFNSALELDWFGSRDWCRKRGGDLLYIYSKKESQGFIQLVNFQNITIFLYFLSSQMVNQAERGLAIVFRNGNIQS